MGLSWEINYEEICSSYIDNKSTHSKKYTHTCQALYYH